MPLVPTPSLCLPARQGINASAEIIRTTHAAVDLRHVLGIRAFSLDRVLAEEPDFLDVSWLPLSRLPIAQHCGGRRGSRADTACCGHCARVEVGYAGTGLLATPEVDSCCVGARPAPLWWSQPPCLPLALCICRRARSTPTPPA